MSWELFVGDGKPHRARKGEEAWRRIPKPPRWRTQSATEPPVFDLPDGLTVAVNAALHLRRPLLLTGAPGSGKSTLARLLAHELELGTLLRWHITSKSTLTDALYQYDALGRLQAVQAQQAWREATRAEPASPEVTPNPQPEPSTAPDATPAAPGATPAAPASAPARPEPNGTSDADVARFVTLGPLGTALASSRPRALLIDEIDKSDLDLPGDLLDVMENGHFTVPVLARAADGPFRVRGSDQDTYTIPEDGTVRLPLEHFPVIVLTSNRERTFPAPFLRRCVRFEMPPVTESALSRIVTAHLDDGDPATSESETIAEFARRVEGGDQLAVNQLLEFVYLVSAADPSARDELKKTILRDLGDA
ncbi:ATPase [Streptomyces sp. NPDC058739]|uniref:ATPase n=1 Tax=Streptomyces sp. NPDC058739 TaxID=3346618 RepID=UPI003689FCE4